MAWLLANFNQLSSTKHHTLTSKKNPNPFILKENLGKLATKSLSVPNPSVSHCRTMALNCHFPLRLLPQGAEPTPSILCLLSLPLWEASCLRTHHTCHPCHKHLHRSDPAGTDLCKFSSQLHKHLSSSFLIWCFYLKIYTTKRKG